MRNIGNRFLGWIFIVVGRRPFLSTEDLMNDDDVTSVLQK
jgi:hypothetical protein